MLIHEQHYLGDGVYAQFDGWNINLAVNDPNNQVIVMEPEVVSSLLAYLGEIMENYRKENASS